MEQLGVVQVRVERVETNLKVKHKKFSIKPRLMNVLKMIPLELLD